MYEPDISINIEDGNWGKICKSVYLNHFMKELYQLLLDFYVMLKCFLVTLLSFIQNSSCY